MTEEVWEISGRKKYLSLAIWPSYDNKLLTKESNYKWNLMNNILDDISNIKLVMKKEALEKISIIIADQWKLKFYNKFMSLVEKTKDQGEIMKNLTQNNELKKHGKLISQIIAKMLKNIGKYPKFALTLEDEYLFFNEIRSVIEKKFQSKVEIIFERDSNIQKAAQALPGKSAIVIS